MPRQLRPKQAAAWRAFIEAHSVVTDALAHELEEARDLPLPWYDVLQQLSEAPDSELRMAELARSVLLSKSGLTRLVDRMEAAGLVERRPCYADGRGLLAAITATGRDALRRAAPVHVRGVEEHFARHLTETEARTLRTAFAKILRAHEDAARAIAS